MAKKTEAAPKTNAKPATEKKTRTVNPKVIRVEDQNGNGGYYFAKTHADAIRMHGGKISARDVGAVEFAEAIKAGENIVGLNGESEPQAERGDFANYETGDNE